MNPTTKTSQSSKQRVLDIVNGMPENSTIDEILHEVLFQRMMDKGMEDSRAGRVITTEELLKQVETWLR